VTPTAQHSVLRTQAPGAAREPLSGAEGVIGDPALFAALLQSYLPPQARPDVAPAGSSPAHVVGPVMGPASHQVGAARPDARGVPLIVKKQSPGGLARLVAFPPRAGPEPAQGVGAGEAFPAAGNAGGEPTRPTAGSVLPPPRPEATSPHTDGRGPARPADPALSQATEESAAPLHSTGPGPARGVEPSSPATRGPAVRPAPGLGATMLQSRNRPAGAAPEGPPTRVAAASLPRGEGADVAVASGSSRETAQADRHPTAGPAVASRIPRTVQQPLRDGQRIAADRRPAHEVQVESVETISEGAAERVITPESEPTAQAWASRRVMDAPRPSVPRGDTQATNQAVTQRVTETELQQAARERPSASLGARGMAAARNPSGPTAGVEVYPEPVRPAEGGAATTRRTTNPPGPPRSGARVWASAPLDRTSRAPEGADLPAHVTEAREPSSSRPPQAQPGEAGAGEAETARIAMPTGHSTRSSAPPQSPSQMVPDAETIPSPRAEAARGASPTQAAADATPRPASGAASARRKSGRADRRPGGSVGARRVAGAASARRKSDRADRRARASAGARRVAGADRGATR